MISRSLRLHRQRGHRDRGGRHRDRLDADQGIKIWLRIDQRIGNHVASFEQVKKRPVSKPSDYTLAGQIRARFR